MTLLVQSDSIVATRCAALRVRWRSNELPKVEVAVLAARLRPRPGPGLGTIIHVAKASARYVDPSSDCSVYQRGAKARTWRCSRRTTNNAPLYTYRLYRRVESARAAHAQRTVVARPV